MNTVQSSNTYKPCKSIMDDPIPEESKEVKCDTITIEDKDPTPPYMISDVIDLADIIKYAYDKDDKEKKKLSERKKKFEDYLHYK